MSDFDQKTDDKHESPDGTFNFGAWLKDQRLSKKVSLEEIAAVTKIHIQQLRGLEEGWNDTPTPANAFIRGFVVSYARHLSLNEAEVLEKFQSRTPEFREKAVHQVKTPQQATYTASSGKPLRFGSYNERKDKFTINHWLSTKRIIYSVLVLLGFALLLFLMKLGRKAGGDTPSADASTTTETSTDVNSPQPLQTQITDKASATPATLFAGTPPFDFNLISTGDCWVNLKVDENSLESFKLAKEGNRKITFNRKAVLTISNISLLTVVIEGKNYKIGPAATGVAAEKLLLPEQNSRLLAQ